MVRRWDWIRVVANEVVRCPVCASASAVQTRMDKDEDAAWQGDRETAVGAKS